jgi:hypothetical protein
MNTNSNFRQFFTRAFEWRQNPALPPKARTEEKAKAKIIATAMVAYYANNVEAEKVSVQAALALLDQKSPAFSCFFPSPPIKALFAAYPIGSGRIQARDGGGYLVTAANRLCTDIVAHSVGVSDKQSWRQRLLETAYPHIYRAANAIKLVLELAERNVTHSGLQSYLASSQTALDNAAKKEFELIGEYTLPFDKRQYCCHIDTVLSTTEPDQNGFLYEFYIETYYNTIERSDCVVPLIELAKQAPVGEWVYFPKAGEYYNEIGLGYLLVKEIKKYDEQGRPVEPTELVAPVE